MILEHFGIMGDSYGRESGYFTTEDTEDTEKIAREQLIEDLQISITTKDTKDTRISFTMICFALEMCAFHDEAQAAVGYSRSRGPISTKKWQVTGRIVRRGFWKRGMPKIATHRGGRGSDSMFRVQRGAVGDFWVQVTRFS